MNLLKPPVATFVISVIGASAGAQPAPWITFTNETSTRLVAAPGLGASDPDEKDYAWGDLDQDGDDDLVVVRKLGWTTVAPGALRRNVLLMNESGVLTDRTAEYASDSSVAGDLGFLTPTNDRDVAVVDVNGDGWLDIVTAPTSSGGQPTHISQPRIYINKGAPNDRWLGFRYESVRIPAFPMPPNFCGVGAGDVTGDGHPDLYFAEYHQPLDDRLLINDGQGFFTDQTELRMTATMVESGFGTHGIIADMNGDNHNDILKVTAFGPYHTSASYNNPLTPGFFPAGNFQIIYPGSGYFIAVGELNNDGRMDLLIVDDGGDHYHLNQGNGPSGQVIWSAAGLPNSGDFGGNAMVTDLNLDGWNDIVVADVDVDIFGCSRQTHIYQNNANPPNVSFTENLGGIPASMLTGGHDVAVMDINGDDWPDLVMGRCSGTQIWINVPPDLPGPAADLNGDEVVDGIDLGILLANWSIPAGSPGCGGEVPCAADINGDGIVNGIDLGILLANWTL